MVATIGIDLGTTSIKMCLLREGKKVEEWRTVHKATLEVTGDDGRTVRGVQSASLILSSVHSLLSSIPDDVTSISISGQQHGVVMWKDGTVRIEHLDTAVISPLYTWEYDGVPQEYLDRIRKEQSGSTVHGGYGCVTLSWMAEQGLLEEYDRAGSIMDLLVQSLTDHSDHATTSQVAASFGFYDNDNHCWTGFAAHNQSGVWQKLLPRIVQVGEWRQSSVLGLVPKCKVYFPLGDLQATLFPVIRHDSAVLNLGTSSQLVVLQKKDTVLIDLNACAPCVRVDPFFDGDSIIIAASLNGGNVVETVAETIIRWSTEFTSGERKEIDWQKVLKEVDEFAEKRNGCNVTVDAAMFGERGMGNTGASIKGFNSGTSAVEIIYATCLGIILNQLSLLPLPLTVKSLRLTGAAGKPRYSIPLREMVKRNVEIEEEQDEVSAAYGAALFAWRSISQ